MKNLLTFFFLGWLAWGSTTPLTAQSPLVVSVQQLRMEQILAHQPDFKADFIMREAHRPGFETTGRMAQKGNRFRMEFDPERNPAELKPAEARYQGKTVYLERESLPSVTLSENSRTYSVDWWSPAYNEKHTYAGFFKDFLTDPESRLTLLGTRTWNGRVCTVIEVRKDSQTIQLYSADDLQGFILKVEVVEGTEQTTIEFSNLSFEVDDSLFVIPPGYLEVRPGND